jgi:hypothetical protein
MKSHIDRKSVLFTATIASAMCIAPVFAQSSDEEKAPRPGSVTKQTVSGAQDSEKKPDVSFAGHRDLVGTKVDNGMDAEAMAELGSVSDLVVWPDGSIESVVIRTGTTLGLGGREIEYPWKSLVWNSGGKTCSIQLTQEQFARLPKFEREFHVLEASASKDAPENDANSRKVTKAKPMLASEWIELPLRTANENFGEPQELIVETGTGTVAFATASIGGVLGLGERTILIPWRAIKLVRTVDDEIAPCLMLSATRDSIVKAPVLHHRTEELASQLYRNKVYKHFGVDAPSYEKNARKAEDDEKAEHGKADEAAGSKPDGGDAPKGSVRKDG